MKANSSEIEVLMGQQAWLQRLAIRLVGDPGAADDLVQDTLIEAMLNNSDKGTGDDSESRKWLGSVLRNKVNNYRRSNLRRRLREQKRSPAEGIDHPPGDYLQSLEVGRALAARVMDLEELHRDAIVMRFYHERSYLSMSEELNVSESAVRSRIQRALTCLREAMDAECDGDRQKWMSGLAPLIAKNAGPKAIGFGAATWTLGLAGLAGLLLLLAGILLVVQSESSEALPTITTSLDGSRVSVPEEQNLPGKVAKVQRHVEQRATARRVFLVDSHFGTALRGFGTSDGNQDYSNIGVRGAHWEEQPGELIRFNAAGYEELEFKWPAGESHADPLEISLLPNTNTSVQVIGIESEAYSGSPGTVEVWSERGDAGNKVEGTLDQLGGYAIRLGMPAIMEVSIGEQNWRILAHPGESITLEMQPQTSTISFVEETTGEPLAGLPIEIYPIGDARAKMRQTHTDALGQVELGIPPQGLKVIVRRAFCGELTVRESSGCRVSTPFNCAAILLPTDTRTEVTLGISQCFRMLQLTDKASGLPITSPATIHEETVPMDSIYSTTLGKAHVVAVTPEGLLAIPCDKLSLRASRARTVIQVDGFALAYVDHDLAIKLPTDQTLVPTLFMEPATAGQVRCLYPSGLPFRGTVIVRASEKRSILASGNNLPGGMTPVFPVPPEGVEVAVFRPLQPSEFSPGGMGSIRSHKLTPIGQLTHGMFLDGNTQTITLGWPAPGGQITILDHLERVAQVVAINEDGQIFEGNWTRSGALEFTDLEPGYYGIGPPDWANQVVSTRLALSSECASLVELQTGMSVERKWNKRWTAEKELHGQIHSNVSGLGNILALVPLYEGRAFWGNASNVPLDTDGQYTIQRGSPVPRWLAVKMNDCVVQVITPGASTHLNFSDILVKRGPSIPYNITSIGYAVPPEQFSSDISVSRRMRSFSLEWKLPDDLVLHNVPTSIRELWYRVDGDNIKRFIPIPDHRGTTIEVEAN